MIILFAAIMLVLIRISPQKFWYIFLLILGVAIQLGYQVGMVGSLVWIGLAKIMNDLIYSGRES
jgi:hypothetical protein